MRSKPCKTQGSPPQAAQVHPAAAAAAYARQRRTCRLAPLRAARRACGPAALAVTARARSPTPAPQARPAAHHRPSAKGSRARQSGAAADAQGPTAASFPHLKKINLGGNFRRALSLCAALQRISEHGTAIGSKTHNWTVRARVLALEVS